jgi:hypothetical protein
MHFRQGFARIGGQNFWPPFFFDGWVDEQVASRFEHGALQEPHGIPESRVEGWQGHRSNWGLWKSPRRKTKPWPWRFTGPWAAPYTGCQKFFPIPPHPALSPPGGKGEKEGTLGKGDNQLRSLIIIKPNGKLGRGGEGKKKKLLAMSVPQIIPTRARTGERARRSWYSQTRLSLGSF